MQQANTPGSFSVLQCQRTSALLAHLSCLAYLPNVQHLQQCSGDHAAERHAMLFLNLDVQCRDDISELK